MRSDTGQSRAQILVSSFTRRAALGRIVPFWSLSSLICKVGRTVRIVCGWAEDRDDVSRKTGYPGPQQVLSKCRLLPHAETCCLAHEVTRISDLMGLPGMGVVGQGPTSEAPDGPGTLPSCVCGLREVN